MASIRLASFVFVAHCLGVVQCFQSRQPKAVLAQSEVSTNTELACIGSMCGRRRPVSLYQGKHETYASVTEYQLRGRHPYCAPDRSSPSRLLLLPMVAHHHGSDALASVLMSSSEVATLCGAKTWQCSGSFPNGTEHESDPAARHGWLERFSHQWDLRKHVLLAPHPDIKTEMLAFEEELQDGPPKAMKQAGIKRVFSLNLIMWRPICLGALGASMYNESAESARLELKIMEDQVALHKHLVSSKQPVLVMSLADLLWAPLWSQSRLEEMIPCIGKLDVDAIPELHKHHYPQNNFQFDTSVKQFGEANPPGQYDYNIKQRTCGKKQNAFRHLPDAEQARARTAVKYLNQWSQ